jgi:hypothetical protein
MNVALLIAVEAYADDGLTRAYAADDARALSAALAAAGYAKPDQVLLVDGQATKTAIESKVRRTLRSLRAEDTLLLHVSALAYSDRGRDFLLCYDSLLDDLPGTSVAWAAVLAQLRDCDCQRVILLLDMDSRGLAEANELQPMQFAELEEFFSARPGRVCLTACSAGETSWPSPQLGHGAWASQVIAALQGNAPTALIDGSLLTAGRLQKFLDSALPRVLKQAYSTEKPQTPQCFGANPGDVLVVDLSDVRSQRTGGLSLEDASRVTLAHEQVQSIRTLPGFKKEQKPPSVINSYAKSLVADLTAEQIDQDVNQVRDALKKHFAFKRKDLDAASAGDGTGSVRTPYFHYSVSVRLNPADPGEVIWRRQVAEITDPEQVLSAAFESVFPKTFALLEFTPSEAIDVSSVIDALEEADDERFKLNYDPAATCCRLSAAGLLGQFEITKERFALLYLHPQPPRQLLEAFQQIQKMLTADLKVKGIGFNP